MRTPSHGLYWMVGPFERGSRAGGWTAAEPGEVLLCSQRTDPRTLEKQVPPPPPTTPNSLACHVAHRDPEY